jgi:hypothetical protein
VPLPEPALPEVIVTRCALLVAVHGPDADEAPTEIAAVAPAAAKLAEAGMTCSGAAKGIFKTPWPKVLA